MQSFRIAHQQFINDLSGFGAQKFGGRWNSVGVPCLYSSAHLSLAVLERMVHAQGKTDLVNLAYCTFDCNEERLYRVEVARLDADWKTDIIYTQWLGDQILSEREYAGFLAPSVVVPGEWNLILNPQSTAFDTTTVSEPEAFSLDTRLVAMA